MRDWGFSPSPDDLNAVTAAAKLYHDHCASLQNPIYAAFDGSIEDVHTLDYMKYDGVCPRGAGVESAAMVCGEVLRRAAGLEWIITYRGDWFVASGEDAFDDIAICPLARLHELECSRHRGAGMYMWFIQNAALDCLPFLKGEEERRVCALLEDNGSYVEHVENALERLKRPSPAAQRKKRRRS